MSISRCWRSSSRPFFIRRRSRISFDFVAAISENHVRYYLMLPAWKPRGMLFHHVISTCFENWKSFCFSYPLIFAVLSSSPRLGPWEPRPGSAGPPFVRRASRGGSPVESEWPVFVHIKPDFSIISGGICKNLITLSTCSVLSFNCCSKSPMVFLKWIPEKRFSLNQSDRICAFCHQIYIESGHSINVQPTFCSERRYVILQGLEFSFDRSQFVVRGGFPGNRVWPDDVQILHIFWSHYFYLALASMSSCL